MKLSIQGNRLYVDNLMFSHVEVKDGHRDKPFAGSVESRFSHAHGRELPIADGLGWLGGEPSCDVVLGRVVKGDGSVMPCKLAEGRLLGLINIAEETGKRVAIEAQHG